MLQGTHLVTGEVGSKKYQVILLIVGCSKEHILYLEKLVVRKIRCNRSGHASSTSEEI